MAKWIAYDSLIEVSADDLVVSLMRLETALYIYPALDRYIGDLEADGETVVYDLIFRWVENNG